MGSKTHGPSHPTSRSRVRPTVQATSEADKINAYSIDLENVTVPVSPPMYRPAPFTYTPIMRIGYGRVSTRDQNPDAQHDALTAAGCEQIFIDKASGKLARRPELDKALLVAHRHGDQLVVTKLDRLGRSLAHLIDLSAQLHQRGVNLVVLDQNIDTSTAMGRMFFQILGAVAEFEHALMSERTHDGLAAARARGRTGGQKPKLTRRQATIAREMYEETGPDGRRVHTVAAIAAEFGVTRPTIYRHLANLPTQTSTA